MGKWFYISTRNTATAELARDADDAIQPFKVTRGHLLLRQSTRHIWLLISTL